MRLSNLSKLFWQSNRTTEPGAASRTANFILILLGACIVGWALLRRSGLNWDWDSVRGYWRLFVSGWWTSLGISGAALIASTLLGAVVALLQTSRLLPLRYLAKTYVEVIRGTPLLVQIYVLFYIVADAAGLENRAVSGILILSIFSGAYLAEVFRSGIDGVARSQLESAMAIGLTRAQTFRHVIFPQALRSVLPPMAGQFVSLIKDSSLLSIIGLNEFTQNARNVASYTYSNFESYLVLAAGYMLLTLPISLWTRRLEGRLRYET